MKSFVSATFAALMVGLVSVMPAKAADYNVTFIGSFFDVFATVDVDGSNNVLSITGTVTGVNGGSISGLEAVGNPNWTYDNLFFYAGNPYVTNGGLLFIVGAFEYNLYSVGTSYFLSTYNPDGSHYNPGDLGLLSASATPLPAALPLFATGLGAMGLLGWRRKRKTAAAVAAA